jgi:hypothetical protein
MSYHFANIDIIKLASESTYITADLVANWWIKNTTTLSTKWPSHDLLTTSQRREKVNNKQLIPNQQFFSAACGCCNGHRDIVTHIRQNDWRRGEPNTIGISSRKFLLLLLRSIFSRDQHQQQF